MVTDANESEILQYFQNMETCVLMSRHVRILALIRARMRYIVVGLLITMVFEWITQ